MSLTLLMNICISILQLLFKLDLKLRGGKMPSMDQTVPCNALTGRRPTTRQINIQEIYINHCLYFNLKVDCKQWLGCLDQEEG